MAEKREFKLWEWAIIFGLTIGLGIFVHSRSQQKWGAFAALTGGVFSIAILLFRKLWGRAEFWLAVVVGLGVHVVVVATLVRMLPGEFFPALLLVPFGVAEAVCLVLFIGRATDAWRAYRN